MRIVKGRKSKKRGKRKDNRDEKVELSRDWIQFTENVLMGKGCPVLDTYILRKEELRKKKCQGEKKCQ